MISQVVEIDGNPVTITLIDMEYGIEEEVCEVDGHYNIFLNARSSHAARLNAFDHAIEHIRRDDWEKADVQLIEAEAHGLVDQKAKRLEDAAQRHREFRRKMSKEIARMERKLKWYERKYSGMSLGAIREHNDQMLAIYEAKKADPDWKGWGL